MVALINEDQSKFFDVDSDRFPTASNMSTDEDEDSNDITLLYGEEAFLAVTASDTSTTLQLSNFNKNSPRLSTKGILAQMNHCDSIRELSLSYSFLTEELLRGLSTADSLHLETLRVEASPETKPTSKISTETWHVLSNRLPNLNFVLLSHLTETEDYEALLSPQVPITHLYFGECVPSSAVEQVATNCPRLVELVVSAYGPHTIDEALIAAARGCPRLAAVGLGDCELTCSGFIEFVSLCCERLRILYVLDTSLLEDTKYDIDGVSTKVSSLLGKSWQPNYVPYW